MDILITAFTPFGGFTENMSAKVMELLPSRFHKLLLPTSYERSFAELKKYLEEKKIDAVVLLGQAPRERLTVERVAINIADCTLADNDGVILEDEKLVKDGENAYFSTLPLKRMVSAAECQISNTAGTYVCNSLMYKALHYLKDTKILCGFIHIPQNTDPSVCADNLTKILGVI